MFTHVEFITVACGDH